MRLLFFTVSSVKFCDDLFRIRAHQDISTLLKSDQPLSAIPKSDARYLRMVVSDLECHDKSLIN
jgi:hypothetical protein